MAIVDALITFGTKLCGQEVKGNTVSDVLNDMAKKYKADEPATKETKTRSTKKSA